MAGTSPTVTATPFAGYVFSNWTVNDAPVSTSASYNVPLNGPVTIDATFAMAPTPHMGTISLTGNLAFGGVALGSSSNRYLDDCQQWQFPTGCQQPQLPGRI